MTNKEPPPNRPAPPRDSSPPEGRKGESPPGVIPYQSP
jgi:hypothetical protein